MTVVNSVEDIIFQKNFKYLIPEMVLLQQYMEQSILDGMELHSQ